MPDLYAVFGNPIAHSKSPLIHGRFAAATGQDMHYEARLAAVDGFAGAIAEFVASGGRGANVTVPFKEEAFRLCTRRSARAELAGAVNTLAFSADEIFGDNTDGAGLVRDITHNLATPLAGRRILLLGAGGAARGTLEPLLAARPDQLVVANRSADKASVLAETFSSLGPISGGSFEQLAGRQFDIVINATSASLSGTALPLPNGLFAPASLAYDMMYGKGLTPFLQQAEAQGAAQLADGLGMLIEQAAEAFLLWRGVRPATTELLAELRRSLTQ